VGDEVPPPRPPAQGLIGCDEFSSVSDIQLKMMNPAA